MTINQFFHNLLKIIGSLLPLLSLVAYATPLNHQKIPTMPKPMFTDCSNTPNCSSSLKKGSSHYIKPIPFNCTQQEAMDRLITIIKTHPNTTIIKQTEHYLHVLYQSRWLKFIDDVEFQFSDHLIHLKSASRVGYYDFNANHKRLTKISLAFAEKSCISPKTNP